MNKQKSTSHVQEQFSQELAQIINLEKQLVKHYKNMVRAAQADELAKCLKPESTDSVQHLSRLKLIDKSIALKSNTPVDKISLSAARLKQPSPAQDAYIIGKALIYQHQKIACYELLYPLCRALNLETESSLIEQTITDNHNTNTWLRQILQNIVIPKMLE